MGDAPWAAIGAYAVLAVAVAVSRWLVPNIAAEAASTVERPALYGENDVEPAELAAAA